jgi:hypothetical protein
MTLRRKIVALTLCLLLLFAMTAAASVLLQSKISEQFSGVVDDYLPLNAAVATVDVFTDRYELDLRRLAVDLRDAGAGAAAIAQQGEAERLREARVLTTTFQKTGAQLDQVVQDPREAVEKRVAMADIRGRFSYMKPISSAMTGSLCAARRRRQSLTARLPLRRTRNCTPPRSAASGSWHCGMLCPVSKSGRRSATAGR